MKQPTYFKVCYYVGGSMHSILCKTLREAREKQIVLSANPRNKDIFIRRIKLPS